MGIKRNLYWGWYVVLGAFLIMGINYGARYCFGIFVKPMSLEYGWSRSVISLGASLMILTYGIGGIFSGYLLDRMAPRRIMMIGATLASAGMILTGFVSSPWQYYLTYGLLCGAGSSCFGVVVCGSSVGKWFTTNRGIAIGTASVGIGVGTMILSPLLGYIVQASWQKGFLFLGLSIFIIVMGLAQGLMKKTPPDTEGLFPEGQLPKANPSHSETPLSSTDKLKSASSRTTEQPLSLAQVFRDSRFWLLALCYSLAVMAEMAIFVHQVAFAIDQGINRMAAAASLGFLGVASILGRFFFGWFSDRISDAKYASSIGFFMMAVGAAILMNAHSTTILLVYALFFGFGYGSIAPMMPILLADRFGLGVLGTTYGVLTFFAAGIGGSAGPLLCGIIYDRFGSYDYAWQINLSILIVITFLILILKPRVPNR
ncbi:Sugar phosphate permease [Syntrophus gentianae]|uniref:Sugar phosphate permease n=1 Tax=Syntrophus gentianae TaxID=43775 RepID=A0A1H7X6E9_9BACT|nr:MFS transporter [Syntrophus gentianae]SEM29235.1 Sugar phosphate permease [Syntrophus gentianae]